MSNGTLLDSTHKLNKTKDDTEVTLNVIPDLLDNIERDLKTITVRKATYTRITSRLEALRDQPHLAIAGPDEIEVLLRTLHDVDSRLSNINQLTSSQRLSRKKHITSVLEDIALLLDDALAGILYGSEFKILEGDQEWVNLVNSGQIFVPPAGRLGSIRMPPEPVVFRFPVHDDESVLPLEYHALPDEAAKRPSEFSSFSGLRSTTSAPPSQFLNLPAAHRGEPTRRAARDEWPFECSHSQPYIRRGPEGSHAVDFYSPDRGPSGDSSPRNLPRVSSPPLTLYLEPDVAGRERLMMIGPTPLTPVNSSTTSELLIRPTSPSRSLYRERHRRTHSPTPSERSYSPSPYRDERRIRRSIRSSTRFKRGRPAPSVDAASLQRLHSRSHSPSLGEHPRSPPRSRSRSRSFIVSAKMETVPISQHLPFDIAPKVYMEPPEPRGLLQPFPHNAFQPESKSPPPMVDTENPLAVDTAAARASSMSLATSIYHAASPNVPASSLGGNGDIGSTGASLGALQPAANASKATVPGALRGVTQFTIEELCEEIRSTPELSNAPIGDLYRREIPSGVQHEFILVRSVPQGCPSIWIRIDRAAKGYRERWRITSRYPADDTGRIGQNGNHRLMAGESRLRAHVVFKYETTRPKVLTLADLVTILHEESRNYKLLSENCYFFTSVIQELLTDLHGGELVSGALGHKKLGAAVRRRVRKRFAKGKTPPRVPPGNGAAPREPIGKAPLVPGPSRRSRRIISFLSRTPS